MDIIFIFIFSKYDSRNLSDYFQVVYQWIFQIIHVLLINFKSNFADMSWVLF